jgi:Sulfotransferase domain
MIVGAVRRTYWWLSRPARTTPTFLVIGAQKSGTTSLRRYLVEHPAVLCAEPKEVHFFDLAYRHGELWYLSHFPWKSEAHRSRKRSGVTPAIGEATPEYLFHPLVPERVGAFDSDLRFVALLRDPVDRAYSQYQMQVRVRGETRSFEEVLALEEAELHGELQRVRDDPAYISPQGLRRSYVARGLYAEQLDRWFRFFERDRFLVLTSTELDGDIAGTMTRIAAFLDIPEWHADEYPRLTTGSYEPMAAETRERLARVFEPHNRRLEALLERKFDWTRPTTRAA